MTTEAVPPNAGTPAAANMAPTDPETFLRGRMDGLVTGAIAHYEALPPSKTQSGTNPYVPERTVVKHTYRDGSEREVITDPTQGLTETKLRLSGAVVDQYGRSVVMVDTKYADGRAERDLRFLPSRHRVDNAYRWSADQPVGELLGEQTRPLTPGTRQFAEAAQLTEQIAARWQTLREHQRSSGSIRAAKAGAGLVGALVRTVTGRRQDKK